MIYMSNGTVIYHNEMNLVPLRKFASVEIDLFFAMCNKLKEQDTNKLYLSFEELKYLSNYNYETRNINRFIGDLQNIYKKILEITYRREDEDVIEFFVLFNHFKIHKTEKYLEISTNPDLKFVLNDITRNFTKFELKELTNLKSSYSKTMFRLLKQYKHTGYLKLSMEDFRTRLDVSKSYQMCDITKRVLKPISKELTPIFNNLNINKVKAKKGRKIEYLEFIFDAEKRIHNKRQPQITNIGKSRQYTNREKTPKWLDDKIYKQSQESHGEDAKLKQDREAFQRQLEEKWEE